MKYTFALSALVAVAAAQEEEYAYYSGVTYHNETEPMPEPKPSMAEKIFEKNEQGQFQLVHPESPAISFTDADDEAIMEWFQGKMRDAEDLDREFIHAWMNYQEAVAQPYNDFLTQVEEITVRGIELDAKTKEEMLTWMASNTFIDGEAAIDKYPQITEALASIEAKAQEMGQSFNLDALRATPDALYYDYDMTETAAPHVLSTSSQYYERSADGTDCQLVTEFNGKVVGRTTGEDMSYCAEPVKDALREDLQKMEENLISYGFDPEVVNAWFEDKSRSFEELQQEQDMVTAEMAQQNVREAADYLKGVADNWVADMPRKHEEEMAMFDEKLQGFINEFKLKVDAQAAKDIASIDAWIDSHYDSIVAFTESEIKIEPMLIEPEPEVYYVALAKQSQKTSKREKYAYGFAASAVGFLAASAYLYTKKKQQKVNVDKQSLLTEEFEFQQV